MEKASSIIRSSIHSFLSSYDTFASIATVLIFPASAVTLLSGALNLSSSSTFLQPLSLQNYPFFDILSPKLSQEIFSFLLCLPFTLTFLCLAKASIIHFARERAHHKKTSPSISSFLHLYRPLALTQLYNSFLILSANATFIFIMFLVFNAVELVGFTWRCVSIILSAVGCILYTTIIANTFFICNLASIVAAMENCNAYAAVIKACVFIRGRAVVALFLAVPTNLCMTAIQAVFQVRVIRPYHQANQFDLSLMCEGITITYMYSIFIVLDIIITCCFYKCCNYGLLGNFKGQFIHEVVELEAEEMGALQV